MTNIEKFSELFKEITDTELDMTEFTGCFAISCPDDFKGGKACGGCPYEHYWESEYKG